VKTKLTAKSLTQIPDINEIRANPLSRIKRQEAQLLL